MKGGAPKIIRRTLPGGATVVAESVPGSRSVAVGAWIRRGSKNESPRQAGLTHFLEHMLFRGTRRRSGLGVAKAVESLGGHVDASTGRETTTIYARVHPENLRRAVNLLHEMVTQPLLSPRLVELEKKIVLEEIQSYRDDPEDGVHELMASHLWPRHPMGRPILGYEETVRSFTSEQLRRFHERSYRGSNIILAASGALDPERFADLASAVFRLPRGGRRSPPPKLPRFRARSFHEERRLERVYALLATRGPSYRDRARYPIYLLNLILGAGSSSRLFQRIREREGLAYAVHTFVESYEETGVFGVFLCLDPRNLTRAFRLLSRELERVRVHGIKRWELESAKAQMVLMHSLAQENVSERMGRLAMKELLFGRQTPEDGVTGAIRAVTADDVLETVDRMLDPSRFCVVTVGPANGSRPDDNGLEP